MVAQRGNTAIPAAVILGLALVLAACGGRAEMDPAKAQSRIQKLVRDTLAEAGGETGLGRLSSYRAEGVITLVPEQRVASIVRWYDSAGRLRLELREKARGEVRIVSGGGTWSGPDDRSLGFGEPSLLDLLTLAAARRDFPLPFVGHTDSLELLESDHEKRIVVRTRTAEGVLVDHHVDPKRHRLEMLSVRSEEEPDFVYRVELGSYRRIRGALFPFRETIYRGKARLAEVRLRDLEPSPDIPDPLFMPPVTAPDQ